MANTLNELLNDSIISIPSCKECHFDFYPRDKFFWIYSTFPDNFVGEFASYNEFEALFMALDRINESFRLKDLELPLIYHMTVMHSARMKTRDLYKFIVKRDKDNFIVEEL